VNKGMILISRANTKELVAACCIVPKDYERLFIPDKLWSITLDENKILPVFFNYLLKNENYRNIIRKKASGGHDSMLNISMRNFRTLTLIKPDNQIDFVSVVNKIDSIKSIYKESLEELENLYGSISQKVFNGELDLSKVDISGMEDSKKKNIEEVKEDLTEEQLDDLISSYEHTLPTGEVPSNRETDIRDMSIRQYLGLPDSEETEGIEFTNMNKDYFYQFIVTKGFPTGFFEIRDLEEYARRYFLKGTGFEFTYENWKTIIFRFIGAKQPIIEQVFDNDDKTVKLKLTDEAFKV
jgi:type I restriction enzyme S subunit